MGLPSLINWQLLYLKLLLHFFCFEVYLKLLFNFFFLSQLFSSWWCSQQPLSCLLRSQGNKKCLISSTYLKTRINEAQTLVTGIFHPLPRNDVKKSVIGCPSLTFWLEWRIVSQWDVFYYFHVLAFVVSSCWTIQVILRSACGEGGCNVAKANMLPSSMGPPLLWPGTAQQCMVLRATLNGNFVTDSAATCFHHSCCYELTRSGKVEVFCAKKVRDWSYSTKIWRVLLSRLRLHNVKSSVLVSNGNVACVGNIPFSPSPIHCQHSL